jgi:integrase
LRVGLLEVNRSLKTYSPHRARLLAAVFAERLQGVFEMIFTVEMEKAHALGLIAQCFRELVDETERFAFRPDVNDALRDREEQRSMAADRIADLRWQISSRDFDVRIKKRAEDLVALRSGPDAAQGPLMDDLLEGIGRALIEQQRLFMQRLEDRLMPYKPTDLLFAKAAEVAATNTASSAFDDSQPVKGLLLGQAIERYLADHERKWTPKTHAGRVRQLKFFVESTGYHRPLTSITAHDIRQFRDAVLSLRKNHGCSPKQSFLQKQTDQVSGRIAGKTAKLIFEPAQAFFRWAKAVEGMIVTNPAEDIRIVPDKGPKGVKSRRPFTAPELEILFSAPLFKGCRSLNRRYDPGPVIIRDAKFWLPILGLYTGARLGELVQLHIRDVHFDEPIPHISIDEQNEGVVGGAPRKHVKSAAGIRKVPLHPDIIELGFTQFIEARRKSAGNPSKRLFPEFPYGADGQASTVASKWFGRFMSSVGLTDPMLVFHSLRHNAEDAFRDAEKPQYVIDRILGHSDGSVSAGYGNGINLETAYNAVCSMKLGVSLPTHLSTSGSG